MVNPAGSDAGYENTDFGLDAGRSLGYPPRRPQEGKDAEKPGEYNLVIRVLTPEAKPGDVVHMEVYITGYGAIRGPKFTFTPPPNFIDEDKSKLIHGWVKPEEGQIVPLDALEFGGDEAKIGDVGFVIRLVGLTGLFERGEDITWEEPSIFWDQDRHMITEDQTPQIATEMKRGRAVIEMELRTKRRPWWGYIPFLESEAGILPGTHTFQGHLTYFNGDQWKSASQQVNVVVPNWFKRHEYITWCGAIIGVLIAAASLVITAVSIAMGSQ